MVQGQGTKDSSHFTTHQQKIGLKIYWALPCPPEKYFPHRQSFPSGNLHKPLILIHQRATQKKQEFQSYGLQNENYNHRKLNNVITWIKTCVTHETISHAMQGHPRWTSHDGEIWWWRRNGKPLQHSCLENPMNSMKRPKYIILKDETLVSNVLLEKSGEIALKGMKRQSQSRNNTQLWMCLVVEVKSDAVKNNIA